MTINQQPISEQDLHAYVDGFLDPARRTTVERYLADHPREAERIARWQTVNEALRKAVTWKAEEPVPAALNLTRLMQARLNQRWVPQRMAASILVALAVGAGAGWIAHTPGTASGIGSVALEAAMAQRVFAADPLHPVEFGADEQAQLVQWVSSRLGRAVTPPNLSKAGYRLLGGRIIATEHGAGCMFLYESSAGTRISLFVRPMQDGETSATMRPVHTENTAGFAWARDGMGYGLVSNNPMTTLHQLADQVRSEMSVQI